MRIVFLITFLIAVSNLFSQEKEKSMLTVKGITTDARSYQSIRLKNVKINIYNYNDLQSSYQSDGKGRFEFEMEITPYMVIEFEKDGFFSKRILIDTKQQKINETKEYYPFKFEILMLEFNKEPDYYFIDFPITRIEYSHNDEDFFYSKKYTDRMLRKQEGVLKELRN